MGSCITGLLQLLNDHIRHRRVARPTQDHTVQKSQWHADLTVHNCQQYQTLKLDITATQVHLLLTRCQHGPSMTNLMWLGPPSSCVVSETLPLVLLSSMLDSMRLMEVYSIPFWPWSGANVMPARTVPSYT